MRFGLTIGEYYPVDSPVHALDPRVKILLVLVFTIAAFTVVNFSGLAAAAALIVGVALVSRVPILLAIKGVRPLLYLLVLTFIIHLFTGAKPWIELGPLHLSVPGARSGALVGIRLVILVVGAAFLTLTSTPIELTDAIESLLAPLKKVRVPAHEIAMMMTIALRFIPTLAAETDKIVKAQASRGARFESSNPVTRARSFIPVLVPLFLSVFRRADELAEAMEARAYRGGEGRTRMRRLEMKGRDVLALILVSVVFAVMAWVGRLPLV